MAIPKGRSSNDPSNGSTGYPRRSTSHPACPGMTTVVGSGRRVEDTDLEHPALATQRAHLRPLDAERAPGGGPGASPEAVTTSSGRSTSSASA